MSNETLSELLQLKLIDVPWPIRVNGVSIEGRMGINKICEKKCRDKTCWTTPSSLIGTCCPLGLTVYEGIVEQEKIKIIGVIGAHFKDRVPRHIDYKDACKGRAVSPEDVQIWIRSVKDFVTLLRKKQEGTLAIALEPLHDAMRLARDVSQLAEKAINEQSGATYTERFEKASETQKSLVKSANLLVDTFDLLEVYLNPEAAKFGQLRNIEIYKLLDKLCKIASNARASQSRPKVLLQGNTRRSYDLFETFKLIPFCLIDNAQKYSRDGADVLVRVNELQSSIRVEIESQGPVIPLTDFEKIFERRFRSEAAINAHPSGMGIGLYISNIVARAHGTKIQVQSTPSGFQIGGLDQGKTIFSFEIRNVL